jgi:predicted GIY-YIG superfamily endonuclease
MEQLYVLQLENGKYYVGKSKDVMKRSQQHKTGNGSAWTGKYKPIKIVELRDLKDHHDENNTTKDYMKKYGIKNVRGGSYTQSDLPDDVEQLLQKEIIGNSDKCYKCNLGGHFANQCPITVRGTYVSSTKDEEEELFWGCEYCHERTFTTEYGCRVHERSCKKKQTEIIYESPKKKSGACYRCGRTSHYASDCYAGTHANGYVIDSDSE